jgi:hypothetical protein
MTDFDGFSSCRGSAPFFCGAYGEGLCSGGANDHNVKGTGLVVFVGVDKVCAFGGAMCSGHELLSVNGGMPPLVEKAVQDVCDGIVPSDSPCPVGATDSVVSVGVAV